MLTRGSRERAAGSGKFGEADGDERRSGGRTARWRHPGVGRRAPGGGAVLAATDGDGAQRRGPPPLDPDPIGGERGGVRYFGGGVWVFGLGFPPWWGVMEGR